MNIISISHMFPNSIQPNNGIFVKERVKYVAKKTNVLMVAPVPFFPFNYLIKKYRRLNNIPRKERFDTLIVHHPRYFCIPGLLKFSDGILYYLSLRKFFEGLLELNDIHILDFHWVYPDAFAGLKWAKKFSKKIVVTIRGNESICYFERSLRKQMLIDTLKSVDHMIAVSNDLKRKVVEEYDVEGTRVSVIPNGIDAGKFFPVDKVEAQKQCGLKPGRKYILALSRLSHEKGLDRLIHAFSKMDKRDTTLLIVGDGPLKNKLQAIVRELGMGKNVFFFGAVPHEETAKWYNAADVFCLPSLWEGCPNVVIESLACGTPVVASNVGGIPDLIPSDSYGFLVPAGDPRSLAKALDVALNREW
ncbi:MAG TPA: glycosyltransferase family 4 protein, partial [Deltaproteobacteria bacterium]|nr:glycosyltransferase family 4 protein [Deltaproteobacteria bacterium]